MYSIGFTTSATKEFRSLPLHIQQRIAEIIDGEFSRNPYSSSLPIKKLHTPLEGYRLRVGDFRILYSIEDTYIKIYRIMHRKDAYR